MKPDTPFARDAGAGELAGRAGVNIRAAQKTL
jgi:hypothetical protein